MLYGLPAVASFPQVSMLGWAGIFYDFVGLDESSLHVLLSGSFSTTTASLFVYFECFGGRATSRWVGHGVGSGLLNAVVPLHQI